MTDVYIKFHENLFIISKLLGDQTQTYLIP